jgi:dCMP deaminase
MDWDSYFMTMAYLVAMRSKDESTHVGAVIVGPDNELRSTGYNSFPMGIDDSRPERQERPEKYYWFAHAERNSIDLAARVGTPLEGCIMYTNGIPCTDCAFSIIMAGIKEVVVDSAWLNPERDKWDETAKRTKVMFEEAGVKLRLWDGELIKTIYKFQRGKKF